MATEFEFQSVTKRFGPVAANSAVSFGIEQGSIHGIVGENGAGKSTIMKVLYGMYPLDEGKILFRGKEIRISSPLEAMAVGVGMVHQHFMLVPTLSVWENVVLGKEPSLGFFSHKKTKEIISELQKGFGLNLPLDAVIETLSVGEQQQVEILKLLYRNTDTLILDEPTAVLTPQEVTTLFEKLKTLKNQGKTIVLITHKLHEVLALTDTVTVMRQGKVVTTVATSTLTKESLAEHIIGRKPAHLPTREPYTLPQTVLAFDGVGLKKDHQCLTNVSFEVKAGEIVGIAGIDGNGQQEIAELIAQVIRPESGRVNYLGKSLSDWDRYEVRQDSIGVIPPDRHKEAMISSFSIEANLLLGHHRESKFIYRKFLYSDNQIRENANQLMKEFDVRPALPEIPMSSLSGGNQQKTVVARETQGKTQFLLACHPTRGVDIGAIEFIYRHFLELRAKGTAILLISSELEEILALSDRILVLTEGRIVAETTPSKTNERELGLWMTGASA